MKGAQAAMMVCLLNVGVLAAGGAGAYSLLRSNGHQLDEILDGPAGVAERGPDWRQSYAATDGMALDGLAVPRLSPTKRPGKIVEPAKTETTTVVKLTDEELRAELTKWLASKLTLRRVVYSTAAANNCAFFAASDLDAKAPPVFVPNGAYFPTYFGKHDNPNMRVLAKYSITVRIGDEGVVVTAPAISEPSKSFDIRMECSGDISQKLLGQTGAEKPRDAIRDTTGSLPGSRDALSSVKEPKRANTEPHYDGPSDTWTLGTSDFEAFKAADISKAVRAVVDSDGKPLGLQITDDVSKDHILAQRGAKPGDIIKAVNGKAVRSLAEARTVIKQEVDAGVITFVVTIERDGVAIDKTFKR